MYTATNLRTDEQVKNDNYKALIQYLYETGIEDDIYSIDGIDPDFHHTIMIMCAGVVKLEWIYING